MSTVLRYHKYRIIADMVKKCDACLGSPLSKISTFTIPAADDETHQLGTIINRPTPSQLHCTPLFKD